MNIDITNKWNVVLLSILTFTACNDSDSIPEIPAGGNTVKVYAEDFIPVNPSSRYIDENGVFSWSNVDRIGIFSDAGNQVYQSLKISEGNNNTAEFTGGGWGLKDNIKYVAYAPLKEDMILKQDKIAISYLNQTADAIQPTKNLKEFDYMIATAAPKDGKVQFDFKHLGCIVRLKIYTHQASDIRSVELKTEYKNFEVSKVINLRNDFPSKRDMQNNIVVNIPSIKTSGNTPYTTVYFMIPPVNLQGRYLEINVGENGRFKNAEGKFQDTVIYKSTKHATNAYNFEAGKMYDLVAYSYLTKDDFPKDAVEIPGTAIDTKDFLINTAGSLAQSIDAEQKDGIMDLTLAGEFNAVDFNFIKSMKSLTRLDLSKGVIKEGGSMLEGCIGLTELILPENAKAIAQNAMKGCTSLKDLKLPLHLEDIASGALYGCESIKSVKLPETVKNIGADAFYKTGITDIYIPTGVSVLKTNALNNDLLATVTLSGYIEKIEKDAIPDGIKTLNCYAAKPPVLGAGNFTSVSSIFVPTGSVDLYKTTWKDYADKIKAIPGT